MAILPMVVPRSRTLPTARLLQRPQRVDIIGKRIGWHADTESDSRADGYVTCGLIQLVAWLTMSLWAAPHRSHATTTNITSRSRPRLLHADRALAKMLQFWGCAS